MLTKSNLREPQKEENVIQVTATIMVSQQMYILFLSLRTVVANTINQIDGIPIILCFRNSSRLFRHLVSSDMWCDNQSVWGGINQ